MPPLGKVAPSRSGKRQVICYVQDRVLDGVKAAAEARRMTLQQALASSINDEAARLGVPLALSCDRKHLFVRIRKAAQVRVKEGTRPSRLGRRPIAGWFDRKEVDALNAFAIEIGSSLQEMAERGLAGFAGPEPLPRKACAAILSAASPLAPPAGFGAEAAP